MRTEIHGQDDQEQKTISAVKEFMNGLEYAYKLARHTETWSTENCIPYGNPLLNRHKVEDALKIFWA